MQITHTHRIENRQWRFDGETGFLRITATILKVGPMQYTRDELPDAPQGIAGPVRVAVTPEALADPVAVASLEGAPATVGHIWQTVGTIAQSVGHIAGSPRIEGEHLWGDVLVTDPEAVRRIMLPEGDPDRLEEISSAYDAAIAYAPGVDHDGTFSAIRYNHLALLPKGAGRAGSSVRIVNRTGGTNVTHTAIKLSTGHTVRVLNEDLPKIEEAETQNAAKIDPAKMAETLAKLTELSGQIKELTAQKEALSGELQAFKAQLDAALDPGTIETKAAEMVEDQATASAVMNAAGLKLSDDQTKLRGHGLRVAVVNSVNAARKLEALPAEASEDYVRGLYQGLQALAKMAPPAGHQIVNNQTVQTPAGPDMSNNAARAAVLWGVK